MKNTKKLRRNIRRISERKGISYTQAIILFYKVKSLDRLDKNLLHSLLKNEKLG